MAYAAVHLGRVQLEQMLTHALKLPVRIERLTYLPGRLTLHQTDFYPPSFSDSGKPPSGSRSSSALTVDRLELELSLLSLLKQRSVEALKQGALQSVAVTGVTLSIGGVPLKARGRVSLKTDPESPARCEGWLKLEHPFLKGRVELSGLLLEPVLLGWFQGVDGQPRHFVSQFLMDSDAIRISQMEIQGGWWAFGSFQLTDAVPPAPTTSFRLGEPTASVASSENLEPSAWKGRLAILRPANQVEPALQYELKFKPLSPTTAEAILWMHREGEMPQTLKVSWEVEDSTLQFTARLLEEEVFFNGQVSLKSPFPLEVTLDLDQAPLPELAKWIFPEREMSGILGRVQGQVVCHGTLERLISHGHLSIQDTSFGGQRFPSASLRFQGEGFVLQLRESHLTRPGGDLLMEGTVDLRQIGQPDFFRAITLISMERNLEVGNWQVSPLNAPVLQRAGLQKSRGVRLRRSSSETPISIGLAIKMDDQMGPEAVSREGMEVGIAISEEESVSLRLEGEEQFLGIEHRKRF